MDPRLSRRQFLDRRRAICRQRYDQLHAATYGVDQSREMLACAADKHPDVPTRIAALQDLGGLTDLHNRFDGLLCVDVMENVGPEDWPVVLAGLRATLRPGTAYLTVELPEESLGEPADGLVVGEVIDDGAYHYYPSRERAAGSHVIGLRSSRRRPLRTSVDSGRAL